MQAALSVVNCIIIAPKRLKLRLSGSARKSQKTVSRHADDQISGRFGSNPAVFITQREKQGDNPDSNPEKWSSIMQFAAHLECPADDGVVRRPCARGDAPLLDGGAVPDHGRHCECRGGVLSCGARLRQKDEHWTEIFLPVCVCPEPVLANDCFPT